MPTRRLLDVHEGEHMGLLKQMKDMKGLGDDAPVAREMMAQTTRAAAIATTGIDATATVMAAAQTGAIINMEPVVELSLTVIPASGLPPYPATLTQPIDAMALPRVGVGATLDVKVDAEDPQSIWIDFASRPA
jgi:hypothetical protein